MSDWIEPPRGPEPDAEAPAAPHDVPPDASCEAPPAAASPACDPDALVMVQFKGHRKACYHNRRAVGLDVGDYCMVEADRGRDMGRVCYVGPGKEVWRREAARQGVLATCGPDDLKRLHENRADEWECYDICLEKIQERRLEMELVTVERQYDRNKITFFFTAEKRVDFRQLVKDLAAIFRTRIELRQIGVRDEAKIKGGMGICGRELCCSSFLGEFSPVTLKMAKGQQLPLSPNKLSGLCGRLRCCLSYEHEGYLELLARMPRVGARVTTPRGEGRVRKLDLLRETATVQLDEGAQTLVLGAAEMTWDARQDLPRSRQRRPRKPCHRDEPTEH